MPWGWDLSKAEARSVLISGELRADILAQLSCGNRIEIKTDAKWTSNDSRCFGYTWHQDDCHYIWVTNDERRKLIKQICGKPGKN